MTKRISLEEQGYSFQEKERIWIRPDYTGITYSDGVEIERELALIIRQSYDVSVFSEELHHYCIDWPFTYHLSGKRANILRPFEKNLNGDILEIGAGCGAITRYLGECGGNVLAIEGSPRRAAIARSRTRDLQNVTVVCEKFDQLRTDRQFDIVTLIGVLEYAGSFAQGKNPAQDMLARARSFLKPDGWLIVAIENQLGLKYFAGAPEDHLGRAMYGIEGRYRGGQARTFGRQALRDLLTGAGFESVNFLAPFPDYKLPISIVTENGALDKDFDAAAFACQSVRCDRQLPVSLTFLPELVWPTLAQNGLLMDMANSFLVVAGRDNSEILKADTLAWHFTTSPRKNRFCKSACFQRTGADGIEVRYRLLAPGAYAPSSGARMKYVLPEKDRYVHGRLLSEEVIHIVSQENCGFYDIGRFLKRYVDILCQIDKSSQRIVRIKGPDSELPGSFLDLVPWNIIVTNRMEYFAIDQEWEYSDTLQAGFLVFRALKYFSIMGKAIARSSEIFEDVTDFIYSSFIALGWPVPRETIQKYDEMENDLQAEVTIAPNSRPLCYLHWQKTRALDELDAAIFQERAGTLWKKRLLFEFCLVLKPGTEPLLADSVDSISRQYYDGWRLTILARTPSPEGEFTEEDGAVRWLRVPEHAALEDFINEHLLQSPAHWLGFFACGTRFAPQLLLSLSDYLAIHPEWRAIYTDEDTVEDTVEGDGERRFPLFKPDFNLELLRSADYVGGLFVERNMLLAAGGYPRIPDAAHFDIALRMADAAGDSAIGHIPDVLVHTPLAVDARAAEGGAAQALREHLVRRGIAGEVFQGLVEGATRRVAYRHCATPRVSILVPTKNRLDLLRPCVESLFRQTAWPDWELLIVDNGSDDAAVLAWYDALGKQHAGRIRWLRFNAPFNYSAMNNLAAREARGEYLLLLNNDTECIHDDWLEAMMAHAQRPDVGVVGARLLFPASLRVQHAGVVLGMTSSTVGHVFITSLAHDEPGYLNRALADQEYSAVTGACLLIRKSLFDEIGGLDEEALRVNFNDVDLCLKARRLGYRVVWTPFATLLHHGSATQSEGPADPAKAARLQVEADAFYQRWAETLADDPAWNRNLSLADTTPTVEDELAVPWQREFHDRPRIVAMPSASDGMTDYRCLAPLRALHAAGKLHHAAVCQPRPGFERAPMPVELARMAPDTLLMHAPVDNLRCQALLCYRRANPGILRVYSVDDRIDHLPPDNPYSRALPAEVMAERLRLGLAASHRLIVSTEALAEAYRHMIDDIRVVPNALDWATWGKLTSRRRRAFRPRVGWAGAQQHAGDLRFVREIVEATRHQLDWVFLGMLPEGLDPRAVESHDFVRYTDYPAKLASLDLDLAIAPLEQHPFNEAKSNLRLLEYGALGWPVICTDILPYRTGDPPVTRLANDVARWIEAILERAAEPDALEREGDALRAWVEKNYRLEKHLDSWLKALLP